MLIVYLLAFISLLPIFAYILSPRTKNKGYIFGISFLVIIFCLFSFVSEYAFLGSIKKQKINTQILLTISQDKEISTSLFNSLDKNINKGDRIYWAQSYINKSMSDKKLQAAESLISLSEKYFNSSD